MAAVAASTGYAGVSRSRTWIAATTTASVALLAGIAAVVSYGHMHQLALAHGEGEVAAALIPLSVDGMIVAASMSLLLDSRLGRRGGVLPWALLIAGALASLAANIAVAEPAVAGRVIAVWPSFALTASYELLMRQVRHAAQAAAGACAGEAVPSARREVPPRDDAVPIPTAGTGGSRVLQRRAWQWAMANRRPDGSLPAGSEVAGQFGRSDRWGRLVTELGRAGQLTAPAETMTAP